MNKLLSLILTGLLLINCSFSKENSISFEKPIITTSSGELVTIKYNADTEYKTVKGSLVDSYNSLIEEYKQQNFGEEYTINRILLNKNLNFYENYRIKLTFSDESYEDVRYIPLNINPSVFINSICSSRNCDSLSGNILNNSNFKINISTYRLQPVKFIYNIVTPYNSYEYNNVYNSPVSEDSITINYIDAIPEDVSYYIALIRIEAYDIDNNFAYTEIPIKVVRPIEIKHFGKHELAEIYEPVPVTGCIPGSVGNNVQYSESTSETRQNSVSVTLNSSWSNSQSINESVTSNEGISISETDSTVYSSSLSNSETNSESFSDTNTTGESNNIQYNTTDGESWSWSLGESESQTNGTSNTNNTNTSVNGSTTVGVSGEGSLPFLAKASGKVEVSAGIQRGWGNSSTNSESNTNSTNRGYSTSGSSQEGRSFGSVQNDSRSHSLSGSYVLSSSTSNSLSESSSLSSGRVWGMSESISSGKVVTDGNSESLAQTVVTSNSSSTTFSYSGYIPRGRFGVFHRQTSRYVKLSEIITYNLDGFPVHAGFIMMNTWSWAPDLSIGNTCDEALQSNLPSSECIIQPCGE